MHATLSWVKLGDIKVDLYFVDPPRGLGICLSLGLQPALVGFLPFLVELWGQHGIYIQILYGVWNPPCLGSLCLCSLWGAWFTRVVSSPKKAMSIEPSRIDKVMAKLAATGSTSSPSLTFSRWPSFRTGDVVDDTGCMHRLIGSHVLSCVRYWPIHLSAYIWLKARSSQIRPRVRDILHWNVFLTWILGLLGPAAGKQKLDQDGLHAALKL